MNSEEKKKRLPLWLYPSTLNIVDDSLKKNNCKSRSEYIEKAVLFYSGYINTQNASEYLPNTLASLLSGIVQTTEDRLARVTFKLALEVCMMMHVMAELNDLPESYLNKLRGKCAKEVKKSIGAVNLISAVNSHDEFNRAESGD